MNAFIHQRVFENNLKHTNIWKYLPALLFIYLCSCSVSDKRPLEGRDTFFVDSLTKIYNVDSIMTNPKKVLDVFTEARTQVTDSVESYKLLTKITQAHLMSYDFDRTLEVCDQVYDFSSREKAKPHPPSILQALTKMRADVLNTRAMIYAQTGRMDSALIYLTESYDLFPFIEIGINIADTHYFLGDYVPALQQYRKLLFHIDSLGEGESNFTVIYAGMARIYQELDNFEMAEQCYEKATQYSEQAPLHDLHYMENAWGALYYRTKDYEKNLEHMRKAVRLAAELEQPLSQGIPLLNIADTYIMIEQPDSARFYLDHVKEVLGSAYFEPRFYFPAISLYAALALLEDNLPEAERLLLQPYDTLSVSTQYLYSHYSRLHELYLRKKDFEKAYFYRKETETYNDSIRNLKVRNNLSEIDMRYGQDTTVLRKDIQLALAESRILQWKYTTNISIVLFLLILMLIAGIIFYLLKKNELRHLKQHSTIVGLRMEIIRNRLSPHFMFNALNVVMPSLGKYKELENPFRALIQLLRDNLMASEQVAVPLRQEIERVQNFLQFQSLKQAGTVRIAWDISPEAPTETLVPSMSIQIPVENAVKYAFLPEHTDALLQILIQLETDAISIRIEDNGVGYNPDNHTDREQGSGSGLKMLRSTIELLNAKNARKITFTIINKRTDTPPERGTRVYILIPVHYKYNL